MKLNEKIKEELLAAIREASGKNAAFPIEVVTSGNIKHLIATEKQASGHFLTAINYNNRDYLIYLIA